MDNMSLIMGKVVKIIDDYTIVINKGSADGVTDADRYLIYYLAGDVEDPDTGESLGQLEMVCGVGKAKHIQEKMTTLESATLNRTEYTTIKKHKSEWQFMPNSEEEIITPEIETIPFDGVTVSCLVKQIK